MLQLVPVLEARLGRENAAWLLRESGLEALPDGSEMIPEADAARLHRRLRALRHEESPALAAEAGARTADYILAHRIPPAAQRVLRVAPSALAARMLARAIARHAWTFAGSGEFRLETPWRFAIVDNPLIRGERASAPLCHWHAAVFERLYRVLVAPDVHCVETACLARGDDVCRFELRRSG